MQSKKIKKHEFERGAASGLGVAIGVLVILAVIGIGWSWHRTATNLANASGSQVASPYAATSTDYTYNIATPNIPNTGTEANTQTASAGSGTRTVYVKKTVTYTAPARTASVLPVAISTFGGPVYHNSVYGLSIPLPAGWRGYTVTETPGGQNGLPGTATYHFYAPGSATEAFAVTVYSKEQWNQIRNQENFAHQNVSDLGEGNYLGENFTWIYSVNIFQDYPGLTNSLDAAVYY